METQAIPERTLVAKAQAGNEEAFTELVRRHSGQIYGLSLNMLRNREDAEDNLQKLNGQKNRFDYNRAGASIGVQPSPRVTGAASGSTSA